MIKLANIKPFNELPNKFCWDMLLNKRAKLQNETNIWYGSISLCFSYKRMSNINYVYAIHITLTLNDNRKRATILKTTVKLKPVKDSTY